jgi:arginine exporter protein ArgO
MGMGQRVTWFIFGALSASVVWLIILLDLHNQLFRLFFHLTGH